uniref:Uncharacterized protein n=1 Tax=Oncorhynchus kisutch TaxID=8019 RepID=A0A8C7HZQ4_ONCKI
MFEPSESAGELVLTIVESGHMLVSQGHDLLDGFSLLDAPSFLKVQQKSDTLLFRLTVKGESCSIRMQFSGSRAEALEERGSAVLRLKEYLPVTTQGGGTTTTQLHPNIQSAPYQDHCTGSTALPGRAWSVLAPGATVLCSVGSWSPSSACVSWTPASLPWWRRWKGS